jgi:hypothetical protein
MRKRAIFGLFALVLAYCSPVCEQAASARQSSLSSAPLRILMQAEYVDDGAVGFAAETTATYCAFLQLYGAQEGARSHADDLLEHGTPAARVYGLILLAQIDRREATARAERLREDTDKVIVRTGCILTLSSVGELAGRISKAEPILLVPISLGQSCDEANDAL